MGINSKEGSLIRLKEVLGVESDADLSLKTGYSRSSISIWRHNGITHEALRKLADAHNSIDVDYVLYGGVVSKSNNKSADSLISRSHRSRLPVCIYYVQSLIGTNKLQDTFKALFDIDIKASLEKNKTITSLTYDESTFLPINFLNEILSGDDGFIIKYEEKNSEYSLVVNLNKLHKDIVDNGLWSSCFLSFELEIIRAVCESIDLNSSKHSL